MKRKQQDGSRPQQSAPFCCFSSQASQVSSRNLSATSTQLHRRHHGAARCFPWRISACTIAQPASKPIDSPVHCSPKPETSRHPGQLLSAILAHAEWAAAAPVKGSNVAPHVQQRMLREAEQTTAITGYFAGPILVQIDAFYFF